MLPVKIMLVGGAAAAGGAGGGGGGGGGGGALVDIFDVTSKRTTFSTPAATAIYQLAAFGTGTYTLLNGSTSGWTWLLSGLNSDYQVRATLVSGTTPSGSTLNSWLSLGTDRTWSLTEPSTGTDTCVLTVEIRKVVDGSIIDTATITITVTVN